MSRKYELLERERNGMRRIRALRDIPRIGVTAGDIGGYVEDEKNLSQEGDCWVCGNAQVRDNAQVRGNARVCGYAQVLDDAHVCGNAQVCGDAQVHGDAWVCGNAQVHGDAWVCGNARVCDYAQVRDNAQVCGDVRVYGDARVCGDAHVQRRQDFLCVVGPGSVCRATTFYRTETGISVACGCFSGALEEFRKKVQKTHKDTKYAREYELACQLAELHILGQEASA